MLCVFLGISAHHKGCCCLDLVSNRAFISRHVIFEEAGFPFAKQSPAPQDLAFLDYIADPMPAPIGQPQLLLPASSPGVISTPAQPRAAAAWPRAASDPRLQARSADADPLPCAAIGAQPSAGTQPASVGTPPVPTGVKAPVGASPQPLAVAGLVLPISATPAIPTPTLDAMRGGGGEGVVAPTAMSTARPSAPPTPWSCARRPGGQPTHHGHASKEWLSGPLSLPCTPLSPVHKTFRSALANPNWWATMEEEHAALLQNHT